MKKTLAILLTCAFAFGSLAATGCGNPCEKFADKLIDCMAKDEPELKKKMQEGKKEMVDECKKDKKKADLAKKCVKESDCKKFMECFEKEAK